VFQDSQSYILIQDTIYKDVDPRVILNVATMGLGIISNAFKEASMYYTMTNGYFGEKKMCAASEALAFIQGTSLEITIQTFGLDFEANNLRYLFYRKFHVK